jgi:hypothetical protein
MEAAMTGQIGTARIDESVSRVEGLRSKIAEPYPFDNDRLTQVSQEIRSFAAHLTEN